MLSVGDRVLAKKEEGTVLRIFTVPAKRGPGRERALVKFNGYEQNWDVAKLSWPIAEKKASRSGPNIPEADRRTVAVKLRMKRDIVDSLHDLAERDGVALSALVSDLVLNAASRDSDYWKDAVPAFVHKNIVDAYEADKKETNATTKHVLDGLRAQIAKHDRICPLKKTKKKKPR